MNRAVWSHDRRITPAALAAFLLALCALPAGAQESRTPKVETVRKVEKGHLTKVDDQRRVLVLREEEGEGNRRPMIFTHMLGGGYLGVELTDLTPELRQHFGAPGDRGVMISRVREGSPAERAGLAVGDIVTAVDGDAIEGSWDMGVAIRRHEAGERADLVVWRDGSSLDFRVEVEEREREQVQLEKLLPFAADGAEGSPQMLRWKVRGDAPEIIFDTDQLHELGESMGKVDWPRLEGHLLSDRNRELEERLEKLEKQLAKLEAALRESQNRKR